jgi:dTDP-4-amino-4,6-dideoxygalactose transaminase
MPDSTTANATDKPAIAGGNKAKTKPYRKEKRYGEEELKQLREALDQGTLFYAQGKKVHAMEQAFAHAVDAGHAVACSSGTAAIHAALMAAGVSSGDEVIVPPITDMGTIVPVMWQGAVPIFCDPHPRTYNMTPQTVEQRITSKTTAVIAVHLAGNACDLAGLRALCDSRKIVLVEDAAQAHGCLYDGKPVGTFGQIGIFSFNEFKHIACGDGGVAITDDAEIAKQLRLATDKAYDRTPQAATRDPKFLANNYRMTELQGAVALAQIGKLNSIVTRRRSWCERLTKRLEKLPGLLLPQITERCTPSWWFYMLRVDPAELGADADQLAAALKAEGVGAGAHYIGRPIYEYPLFKQHSAFAHGEHPFARVDYTAAENRCPVAEEILKTCVIVPVNEAYSDEDLDETAVAFEKVVPWLRAKR